MKEMKTIAIDQRLNYSDISRHVYQGDVLLFNSGGGDKLIQAARNLCRDVFGSYDIEKAHLLHSKNKFLLLCQKVQQEFNQPLYKKYFENWLSDIGIEIDNELYWDVLGLRIAPPVESHGGGYRSHIGVHRDTWGVGIQQQINWWAPIMPLAYKRTLAFYPDYWQRKLANNTATWSIEKYLHLQKTAKNKGKAPSYPSAPQNTSEALTPPYMVRPSCGQILAFSSAHLHSSVINRTDRTRFSFEIRTVHVSHIQQQFGAPNVDCDSHPPLYRLFRSIRVPEHLLSQTMESYSNNQQQIVI